MIKNFIDALRRSLWFIPFLMTLCGLFLGFAFNNLDRYLWDNKTPYLTESWGINYVGVQTLFTSVSAAIITAMTTILSITLLIFTVLAGQYGANVLNVFKIRTFSKFVIGWLSAVYIYIIYHVYAITTGQNQEQVPQISITFGIIFTILTLFIIILYINYLVRQIQVGTVVSQAATELNRWIGNLGPYKQSTKASEFTIEKPLKQSIDSKNCGYIQSIDKESLIEICDSQCVVIELHHRPGDFLVTGERLLTIHTENFLSDAITKKISSCLKTNSKRISLNDLEQNLNVLIEMTLRALSPSTNDMFIANNCIDYLCESIARLVQKAFPNRLSYSDQGEVLLISKEFNFEGYLNATMHPLRQYATQHLGVVIRLLHNLLKIKWMNIPMPYEKALERHFLAIYEAAIERHPHPFDQDSLKRRLLSFSQSSLEA